MQPAGFNREFAVGDRVRDLAGIDRRVGGVRREGGAQALQFTPGGRWHPAAEFATAPSFAQEPPSRPL